MKHLIWRNLETAAKSMGRSSEQSIFQVTCNAIRSLSSSQAARCLCCWQWRLAIGNAHLWLTMQYVLQLACASYRTWPSTQVTLVEPMHFLAGTILEEHSVTTIKWLDLAFINHGWHSTRQETTRVDKVRREATGWIDISPVAWRTQRLLKRHCHQHSRWWPTRDFISVPTHFRCHTAFQRSYFFNSFCHTDDNTASLSEHT